MIKTVEQHIMEQQRRHPHATGEFSWLLSGITLATKFFLWPLVVWLAATRRFLAAAVSLVVGSVLIVASWAVIGLPPVVLPITMRAFVISRATWVAPTYRAASRSKQT